MMRTIITIGLFLATLTSALGLEAANGNISKAAESLKSL